MAAELVGAVKPDELLRAMAESQAETGHDLKMLTHEGSSTCAPSSPRRPRSSAPRVRCDPAAPGRGAPPPRGGVARSPALGALRRHARPLVYKCRGCGLRLRREHDHMTIGHASRL